MPHYQPKNIERFRRVVAVFVLLVLAGAVAVSQQISSSQTESPTGSTSQHDVAGVSTTKATEALVGLTVKGRAPKTGYAREQFGAGWAEVDGCDMRNVILKRDMTSVRLGDDGCTVLSGMLDDPYTGRSISFKRGPGTSNKVQIDHVVALSDAWQKGAQSLDEATRAQFANDPLELLAVDGSANQKKSDGDAATWLPANKGYRCRYVARQIAVKIKYRLWVTPAEKNAMTNVLSGCPSQVLPLIE